MTPGYTGAAGVGTQLFPPLKSDFMQRLPFAAVHVRLTCQPAFGGLPNARMLYPEPPILRAWIRSRKYEKFAGVENARLYVNRRFCVSFGLNTKARRGENC